MGCPAGLIPSPSGTGPPFNTTVERAHRVNGYRADGRREVIWLWRFIGLRRLVALFALRKAWQMYQARKPPRA